MESMDVSMDSHVEIEGAVAQTDRKHGGWVMFPFLAGSMFGMGLSLSGTTGNLIVYLINEFNVKSIDAAQISNIINGCINLAPVAGAIVSDAFFGAYPVLLVSTVISLLSTILFTLTSTLQSLKPTPCTTGTSCQPAKAAQLAVLYAAVGLIIVGTGGTRFNTISFGASQFEETKDKDVFFNWYFVILYGSMVLGSTAIVYVQDSISWGLGFGLCIAANSLALVLLLAGSRYYRRPRAVGSPFTGLARVVVAAVRKRNVAIPSEGVEYYYGAGVGVKSSRPAPTQSFWFLNRAAVIGEGETRNDGSVARPWTLCTVEQVEDLKTLIRIAPLWTSAIYLSVSIGVQFSLTVLQALTVDRALSPRFTVPAGSLAVTAFLTVVLLLPLIDRLLLPSWRRLTARSPTPLQRVGAGHVLNAAAMAASALVERRRAAVVEAHRAAAAGQAGWVVPMSVLWLVLPLAVNGAGEAMHFPGQVALYYQEFPAKLKSTATAMIALLIALGFYLSTAVVDLVRRLTDWLPDDINNSRLENVYWMMAVLAAINFGYYLICARLYKYQNVDNGAQSAEGSSTVQ